MQFLMYPILTSRVDIYQLASQASWSLSTPACRCKYMLKLESFNSLIKKWGCIVHKHILSNIIRLQKRYSKTCLKRPLSKSPKIGWQDQLSLNAGQKYCRMLQGELSAILSTFIKLPFVNKIIVLSIFEWFLKTGFIVLHLGLDCGTWSAFNVQVNGTTTDITHLFYHAMIVHVLFYYVPFFQQDGPPKPRQTWSNSEDNDNIYNKKPIIKRRTVPIVPPSQDEEGE